MYFEPHASGVGVWIMPPVGYDYRVWRTPGPVVHEVTIDPETGEPAVDPVTGQLVALPTEEAVPILTGRESFASPYLDWSVPPEVREVTYWIEARKDESSPWEELERQTLSLEVETTYSLLQDGLTMDVFDVRDAIGLFFSVRLAEAAREGHIKVKKPEWKKKFPMTVEYDFQEADLPLGAVGLAYGRGAQGDLGWNYTQEEIKCSLQFVAETRAERDEITRAIRGLLHDLNWFLDDLGCTGTELGELAEGFQNTAPVLYSVELAIGTTCYIWHGAKDIKWKLLPITWFATADQRGLVVSPLPAP